MVEEEEITPFAHENINSSSAAIPLEIINKKEEELPKVDTSLFTGVITNQNADNKSKGSSQGEHNGDSNSSDIIMDQERNDGGTKSDVMLSQDTVLIDSHTLFADANNPKDNMGKRPSEPMDGLEWSEPVDVDLEQGDTMSLHNIRKAKNSEMKMQLENGAIGSIDADLENYESTGDLENGKSSRTRPCKSDSSSILLPGPARQRLLFLSGRAGLQNEQAMEEILADNGFEQLAVYCREFAQR